MTGELTWWYGSDIQNKSISANYGFILAGNRRYYSAAKNKYICTNVLVSILYDKYMQYPHMYIKSSCEVVNGHYVWHFTTLYVIQILRTFLQLPFTLGKKKGLKQQSRAIGQSTDRPHKWEQLTLQYSKSQIIRMSTKNVPMIKFTHNRIIKITVFKDVFVIKNPSN